MHTYQLVERGTKREKAKKALILLHGRGADAEDILGLADFFAEEDWYVVAPQATNHSWYPYSFMVPAAQNQPWLNSALELLQRLIGEITAHLPVKDLYIMGFSQGACLTSEIAARYAAPYGGVVAFTGGLIGAMPDYSAYKGDFQGASVYMSNGSHDPHVPASRSEETRVQLEKMGASVKLDIFPGRPHTISQQEIGAVKSFIFKNGS